MAREELTRLTGNGNGNGECGEDDCPNVYRTERGTFVCKATCPTPLRRRRAKGL
jgi:hypothetical protein